MVPCRVCDSYDGRGLKWNGIDGRGLLARLPAAGVKLLDLLAGAQAASCTLLLSALRAHHLSLPWGPPLVHPPSPSLPPPHLRTAARHRAHTKHPCAPSAQIYPHGSTDSLPYCTMGSGSLNAMAVFEAGYRDDMSREEAVDLVTRAIR